ncbi:MAG: DUF4345 family protein [Xanthobacteraceae bacterium]
MTHAATTAEHHLRGALRAHDTARVGAGTKRVSKFWNYAPWLVRLILAVPTLLFIRIGEKYVSDPLQVAAGSAMQLGSPAAVTDTRVVGAMFLAVAALTLFSIFSTRRLLAGLVLVAFVIGFVTAARVLGAVVDGAAPETVLTLGPEVVLLIASVIGILIELRRQRHLRQL